MGYISRKLLPACENVCFCCPALKPSSRRPVKRHKKLLAEIFSKNLQDATPNERKIIKLCEYAAKNPSRIPKISRFLEKKCYKELQSEHFFHIKAAMEVYCKLACICKEQMAFFVNNLLSVVIALLDRMKQDYLKILGCQTLSALIYNQVDGTFASKIESIVSTVSRLAREHGGEHNGLLQVASLQCLSSMVWFMSKYSYIFSDFDQIIYAILENYVVDEQRKGDDEGWDKHHKWVDEVIRCETRAGPVLNSDAYSNCMSEPMDYTMLTREECENPNIWSQICLQKVAEVAKESSTLRRILVPMFTFFDMQKHWAPKHGLAQNILLKLTHLSKASGNEQIILIALIRHLDNKDIMHDSQLKSNIVQIATSLVKQLSLRSVVIEIGVAGNLCRHLRKSLQITVEIVRPEEASWNFLLQDSIEDCLLKIIKRIGDASLLYDMITMTLENLPSSTVLARATMGSLLILARIVSLSCAQPNSELVFPEALLLQLLKAMLHPDVETRAGAHMTFFILLTGTVFYPRYESELLHESKKVHFKTLPAFASATVLLEKLQKQYGNEIKQGNATPTEIGVKVMNKEEWKLECIQRTSPFLYKLNSSFIDRTAISNYEAQSSLFILNEDQIGQLLSAFWRQAHQMDNLPSNYEAIALSFHVTILSFHLKNLNYSTTALFFQLLLSFLNISLDANGLLPPSTLRSLFTFSVALLAFAGKLYEMADLIDLLKHVIVFDVDPYLKIGDDFFLYVNPQSNLKDYGSEDDQTASLLSLAELREKMIEICPQFVDVIAQHLSIFSGMEKNGLANLLSAAFLPEDGVWTLLRPTPMLGWDVGRAPTVFEEPISFDEESSRSSIDGDALAECMHTGFPRLHSSKPESPSVPPFVSVGQLLESALQVAGEVSGSSISNSPLTFGTMASQCEALGLGTRKKLSTWLVSCHDEVPQNPSQWKVHSCDALQETVGQPWRALKLPPASPFDNFMKAAGC